MKILHVIRSMDPTSGGPCQSIRNSNQAMLDLGVEADVVSLDNPSSDYLGNDDFTVFAMGPERGPWFYSEKFIPWLEQNISKYQVVIMNGLWLYQSYATQKVIAKVRKSGGKYPLFFVMPHGMLDPYFQRASSRRIKALRNWIYWKLVEKNVVNDADALLFTCQTELILAREPFTPYHPKKEINIGFGVKSPPQFKSKMTEAFEASCPEVKGKPYFLFLSRIHEKKGVDILIQAYCRFVKANRNTQRELPILVIAGPGLETEYGRKIKWIAEKNQVIDLPILFPGMLVDDSKWGAFYGCEAFVLPSHQENFGIAIVEALACARPVLISNKINIWMEIYQESAGLISDDTENETFNMLTKWHQLQPLERENMGNQAIRAYRKYFGVEPAARNLLKVFEEATK